MKLLRFTGTHTTSNAHVYALLYILKGFGVCASAVIETAAILGMDDLISRITDWKHFLILIFLLMSQN